MVLKSLKKPGMAGKMVTQAYNGGSFKAVLTRI
jgi:hypothetical protein